MFSRSCEYGLQAALYIALQSKTRKYVGLKEIVASQGVPLHFLSKILQVLVKHKLLVSAKGKKGGFALARPASGIQLLDIVKAIDGLDIFDRCAIGLHACSDTYPCPVHDDFKVVKNRLRKVLTDKTLDDLATGIEKGETNVSLKFLEE